MSEEVEVVGYQWLDTPHYRKKLPSFAENQPDKADFRQLMTVAQHQRIVEQLEKDSARYRWLVSHATYGIDYRQRPELTLPLYAPDHRSGLDAAIDEALSTQEATQ